MKRNILFSLILNTLLLGSLSVQAQSDLYNKIAQTPGIESFYFTRDMLNKKVISNFRNESLNLESLDINNINSLEYLSATKRKAIKKLRKEVVNELDNNKKKTVLMQQNSKIQKINIVYLGNNNYRMIIDSKKRFTIIQMNGFNLRNSLFNYLLR